ncbi:IPT/TIG domain-containing protein [Tieghemostelium lacteum]|uniref:IPT/TIG domain-containing protein n=1 Tax=Tieghemostelium lacteum TaxID=361077 RepID=A0A152A7S3_TIELA|nr:IPT/TIG domain-containing protein [Tieghemostelium lacteum]|eukprot:KYR02244.1 IPT/TIG domain-containing protein [Tieghemostelium lacteum]
MKPYRLCIFIFVLLLSISTTLAALSASSVTALEDLEDDLDIVWLLRDSEGKPQCTSYTDLGSYVGCNAAGTQITELILYSRRDYYGSIRDSVFTSTALGQLQRLTVINAVWNLNTTNYPRLTTHDKIKEFNLISENATASYVNFGTSTQTYAMNALFKVYINNCYGFLPLLSSQVPFRNISIIQHPVQSLTTNIPSALFTDTLDHFNFRLNTAPSNALPSNIFTLASGLQYFQFQAPSSYQVNLGQFLTAPSSLKVFGLYNVGLTSNAMPAFTSTSWNAFEYLALQNLGLTGTFDVRYLYSPNLRYINIANNPLLTYSLTTEFGEKSSLTALYTQNTGLTGQVPSNILERGLEFLNVVGTGLNGLLPSAFMCCSKEALFDRAIPPSYVFNNNSFSNYFGPNGERSCTPVIQTIQPTPWTTVDTYITISGKDLGDSFQISLRNTIGQTATMGCSVLQLDVLECTNPYIQGRGDLIFKLIVDGLPTYKTTFTYKQPVIYSVSQISTLGGAVTITGDGLFRSTSSLGSAVKIYGIDCTDIIVLETFTKFQCTYGPGITSGSPVVVSVKGIESNANESPKFYYKAPLVTGVNALPPNTNANLTISGTDFWNDVNQTTVLIGNSIQCPVLSVNHTTLICNFPSTPYTATSMNLQVTVADRNSPQNRLFQFIDTAFCPRSCSGGNCDVGIGFCVCQDVFGPSCSEGNKPINKLPTTGITTPTLSLTSPLNNSVKLDAFLYSVIENGAETIISNWNSTYNPGIDSWLFEWILSNKKVQVQIRYNKGQGTDTLSGSSLTYPESSYTYVVKYQTGVPIATLSFKFAFQSSEACPSSPVYAYPTGDTQQARWMVWTKDVVKYHARFPIVAMLNGEYARSDSKPIGASKATNNTEIIISMGNPQNELIYSAGFQYDFEVLQAQGSEIQPLTDSCLTSATPEPTSDDPSNVISKDNSKKNAIIGGVVGGIGGLIIIAGALFILKQQIAIKKTNSLLDQKLKSLNRTPLD